MDQRDETTTTRENETVMTTRMPRELLDAFNRRCRDLDRNKSQIVRDLIRSWLESNKQPKLPL